MRRVLITGGAGFIGSNFVYYWLNKHPQDRVVVLDALTYAGNRENLCLAERNQNFRFISGDIKDYDLVKETLMEEGLDTIVHFAAESHVDRSILGPDTFVETNIVGTHSLLKAAKAVWLDGPNSSGWKLHRFHHVSTDEVYGSLKVGEPPFTETSHYSPNSPYAASKAAADHLVRAYCRTYGLNVTISNCSNNYGPYQYPEKLIPLMISNAIEGKPLPIYGDGQNIRDWLYVEDHCHGIGIILEKGKVGETYNIGGNSEKTNLDLVETLCQIFDEKRPASTYRPHRSLITFVKDRPGHDRRYAIDASKMEKELWWRPEHPFEKALEETVVWYLTHPDWVSSVMSRDYQDWIKVNYEGRIHHPIKSKKSPIGAER